MSANNKDTICRVCLSGNHDTNSIFNSDNFLGSQIQINEVIKACASVQIDLYDGLPQQICLKCLHQLHQSFAFKSLCELSDTNLRLEMTETEDGVTDDSDISSEAIDINKYKNCVYLNTESPNVDKESEVDIKEGLQILKLLEGIDKPKNCEINAKEDTGSEKITNLFEECEFYNNKCDDSSALPISANIGAPTNQVSESKWYCTECNTQFQFPSIYNLHMKKHKVGAAFHCEICGNGFTKKDTLAKHKLTHKPKTNCSGCSKPITSFVTRNRYLPDDHQPTQSFKCHFCHQRFALFPDLQKHIAAHALGFKVTLTDKVFVCDFCLRRFDDSETLAEHKHIHAGEKRKVYKTRTVLPYNKRSKIGGNQFECDICLRTFTDLLSVSKHKATHKQIKSVNGDKNYFMYIKPHLEKA